ncbi:MAG: hypothetical protein JWN70_6776 [Planctomycetaceae bacterium]|nr:hypothetical protein [Planctomycetaceae bacterium]
MNVEQVIANAHEYIKAKYPLAPTIIGVHYHTERQIGSDRLLFIESWHRSPGSDEMCKTESLDDLKDSEGYIGKWLIYFSMSWSAGISDTPHGLVLLVDDCDEKITQISP